MEHQDVNKLANIHSVKLDEDIQSIHSNRYTHQLKQY
jgi:hypothetical protein